MFFSFLFVRLEAFRQDRVAGTRSLWACQGRAGQAWSCGCWSPPTTTPGQYRAISLSPPRGGAMPRLGGRPGRRVVIGIRYTPADATGHLAALVPKVALGY